MRSGDDRIAPSFTKGSVALSSPSLARARMNGRARCAVPVAADLVAQRVQQCVVEASGISDVVTFSAASHSLEDDIHPIVGRAVGRLRERRGPRVHVEAVTPADAVAQCMQRSIIDASRCEVIVVVGVASDIRVVGGHIHLARRYCHRVAKLTCCQPEVVSFVNVARASNQPPLVHRLPTWVPVFSSDL